MNKPLSIAYRDYKQAIVDITNNSGLPAFLIVEVIENVFRQVLQQKETELKRDEALWHKAQTEATPQCEVNDDGRQEDK